MESFVNLLRGFLEGVKTSVKNVIRGVLDITVGGVVTLRDTVGTVCLKLRQREMSKLEGVVEIVFTTCEVTIWGMMFIPLSPIMVVVDLLGPVPTEYGTFKNIGLTGEGVYKLLRGGVRDSFLWLKQQLLQPSF